MSLALGAETTTRSKLATLNEKLATMERQLEYLEAQMSTATSGAY